MSDDPRLRRCSDLIWALRQLGIPTRDAISLGASLENAEHPFDAPRWGWCA